MSALDTGIKNVKNVQRYTIGEHAVSDLPAQLDIQRKQQPESSVIFFIDEFFRDQEQLLNSLKPAQHDELIFVSTADEPTTEYIDRQILNLKEKGKKNFSAIVGIGGGIAMDVAKAISKPEERT